MARIYTCLDDCLDDLMTFAGERVVIGTPLGIGVTLGSELCARSSQLAKQCQSGELTQAGFDEYLEMVRDSGELLENNMRRASELINGFKQLAVDQSRLQARELDVSHYLRQLVRSLQPRYKHSPNHLQASIADGLALLTVPGYLAQVLTNLINNAFDHGLLGLENGVVRLQAEWPDQAAARLPPGQRAIRLVVSDNGRGIPLELQARVFEQFFTTAADRGGTGLGLPIARGLMTEKLNGRLEMRSTPGQGTSFELLLHDLPPSLREA